MNTRYKKHRVCVYKVIPLDGDLTTREWASFVEDQKHAYHLGRFPTEDIALSAAKKAVDVLVSE